MGSHREQRGAKLLGISGIIGIRQFSRAMGYTISNLHINRDLSSYIGLFRHVSGHIRNVGMKDVNITGGSHVGSVVGSVGNNHQTLAGHTGSGALGSVSLTYATGRVQGNNANIGRLVGDVSGYIIAT